MTKRRWTGNTIRATVFARFHGRCCYCGVEVRKPKGWYKKVPSNLATLEHLCRKADGGGSNLDNIALACYACNTRRGAMNWVEYKTLVERRKAA